MQQVTFEIPLIASSVVGQVKISTGVSLGDPKIVTQYQCHCGRRYASEDSPSYGCSYCERLRLDRQDQQNRELLERQRQLHVEQRICARCGCVYREHHQTWPQHPLCLNCDYRDVLKLKKLKLSGVHNWKKEGF